jgi:hypothetical protein
MGAQNEKESMVVLCVHNFDMNNTPDYYKIMYTPTLNFVNNKRFFVYAHGISFQDIGYSRIGDQQTGPPKILITGGVPPNNPAYKFIETFRNPLDVEKQNLATYCSRRTYDFYMELTH